MLVDNFPFFKGFSRKAMVDKVITVIYRFKIDIWIVIM